MSRICIYSHARGIHPELRRATVSIDDDRLGVLESSRGRKSSYCEYLCKDVAVGSHLISVEHGGSAVEKFLDGRTHFGESFQLGYAKSDDPLAPLLIRVETQPGRTLYVGNLWVTDVNGSRHYHVLSPVDPGLAATELPYCHASLD